MEGSINGSTSSGSRAERFEDEKRRIIDSCFMKKDDDGSLTESYITHIRILEDAAYPSSPPPPNTDPKTKKQRLIVVAVRKSGRVRMHKCRENPNGSFSIGKTWLLDDLSAVQSYNGVTPSNPQEDQQKQWAGQVGFTVTIGKPYYWQANTQKEKQFFIASLVKIYTKYTGGNAPELKGFDEREKGVLLGVSAAARSTPPPPPPLQSGPGPSYQQAPTRPSRRDPSPSPLRSARREPSREPPILRKQISREQMQRPPAQMPPQMPPASVASSLKSQTSRPQMRAQRGESPNNSLDSNGVSQQALPSLRKISNNNQSQDSFARSDDGGSLPPRSRGGLNGVPNASGRFGERSVTPNSQRAITPESTYTNGKDTLDDVPPVPAPLALPPERRRPPMPIIGDSRHRGQTPMDNIVPAPLSSPGMRRDDLRPPTRSSERSIPREMGQDISVPAGNNTKGLNTADTSRNDSTSMEQKETPQSLQVGPQPPIASLPTPTPLPLPASASLPTSTPLPTSSVSEPTPTPPAGELTSEPEEEARPGLGPMIKKKTKGDVANSFLTAARAVNTFNSFNSFKPRAGGAAEKMREALKSPEGPDGITSVVPAPSLIRGASSDSANVPTPALAPLEKPPPRKENDGIPEVKITVPPSGRPNSVEGPLPAPKDVTIQEKPKGREAKRDRPPAETMAKELRTIGVEPSILGDRGGELVNAWEQFGWSGTGMRTKNIDQMQDEIERELNKAQAGGWLNKLDEEDERIEAIQQGLSTCMDECDELDGLFTLYLVELGTLNEDIQYIEAQSQGLQVQAANQKLLQTELKSLLDTISIGEGHFECLQGTSLESVNGLQNIETSLVMLFKAMLTIDPSLGMSASRHSMDGSVRSGKKGGYGDSEIGSMRILQEKKDVYKARIADFIRRLKTFLQVKFAMAVDETRKALETEKGSGLSRPAGKVKLDPRHHDLSRDVLWRYSPLMLFSREVDRFEWEELMKMYEAISKPLYQDEFRDAVFAWKRTARKPMGDESDNLFTSQVEKQEQGIATTARKLTVKRSQTLAKSLRSPISDNSSKPSVDRADGRPAPYEVFGGILDEVVPIITMEQNFIVEFFHVTSLEQHDFPDTVAASPPDKRHGGDLKRSRVMDPNRDLANLVVQSMNEVYSFFAADMRALVEWTTANSPLQGIGVMVAVERKLVTLEESDQEYLTRTLQKLHATLVGMFNKFLDDQIRAIEDTKVKIKKRKGVIAFIRIFPSFSLSLEAMLNTAHDLDIRRRVNEAYNRINKTMFDSLKVIARENPGAQIAGADPEDKEALNYQILLIENMNHYLEEVDPRANPVLEDWKQSAAQEMDEHMSLYLSAVIRRPLGKLLDFLESTESLMLSRQPGEPASKISGMPSHSKSTFRKVLSGYEAKEIRRGVDALKKRVEKHFGDADDPGLSRGLVAKVISNCEAFYEKVEDRILTISRDVYDGDVTTEWTREDVRTSFRR